MAVNQKHPLYEAMTKAWTLMRHAYAGQSVIRANSEKYLPPTPGMVQDGWRTDQVREVEWTMENGTSPGSRDYMAYRDRAEFPDYTSESVEKILGLMHQKKAVFELPDQMKPLLDRCTLEGEGLQDLLRRINEQQLITSRLGLLADIPASPRSGVVLPYIAMYDAERIINWDEGDLVNEVNTINMVVLDESGSERVDTFEWKDVSKYRVLVLGAAATNESEGEYRAATVRDTDTFSDELLKAPTIAGRTLGEIPFVFINAKDLVASPAKPVLLGLADKCVAVYKMDADHKQNLFMQGQDTLVVKGGAAQDEALRTGAGARINVPTDGDAKYIGVQSLGLPEQRQVIEAAKVEAKEKALQLFKPDVSSQESGKAMNKRITSQTASLNQIVLAGAAGLENILKKIAVWMGLNPDDVRVEPNVEFVDYDISGQDWAQLMTAQTLGLPLSRKSVHRNLQERGLTNMTFEEEMEAIRQEGREPLRTNPADGGVIVDD